MIAVDTNGLVRPIVADDPEQAALARALIEDAVGEGEACFVSTPVLCELEWVLVSRYKVSGTEVAAAVQRLPGQRGVCVRAPQHSASGDHTLPAEPRRAR